MSVGGFSHEEKRGSMSSTRGDRCCRGFIGRGNQREVQSYVEGINIGGKGGIGIE